MIFFDYLHLSLRLCFVIFGIMLIDMVPAKGKNFFRRDSANKIVFAFLLFALAIL